MKLACLRCKRKKVKCDKGDPTCHQCITAKETCQYVERRQRPRLAQQRVGVYRLNQRLELLEKQITIASTGERNSPSTPSTVQSRPDNASTVTAAPSGIDLMADNAQESWIYRMATDTRRKFEDQTTPISTPTPHIDDVMSSLNDALKDLGKIKIRAELTASKVGLDFSVAQFRQCIDAFVELMSTMVVPGMFDIALDIDLLRMLPSIINSPYIKINPCAYVLYYSAIHWGAHQSRGPGDALTQTAYLKMLEAVPAWLDASTETDMDGYTAALTSWAAINNLDYQLSWKFHCKACHFIKVRSIDYLDLMPAKSSQEEDTREATRCLYWHILSMDCLFRLFYGKPSVLSWSPNKVRPPSVFTRHNMHPKASKVMVMVIWTRYTILTVDIIDFLDNYDQNNCDESVLEKVDEFCMQLEELVAEWDMETHIKNHLSPPALRCLMADHMMSIYAIIIGVRRLSKTAELATVNSVTLRAARKVVSTLLYFESVPTLPESAKNIFTHFISFYPFCAIFSLYEHIVACTDSEECEEDVRILESIGDAMVKLCAVRPDFVPFARTVNALNKVSRALQDERRKNRPDASSEEIAPNASNTQQQFQNVASIMPDFDCSAFGLFSDLPMDLEGNFDPLGFVRAIENDFTGRNWHENWWDMESGVDEAMADIPGI